VKIINGNMDRNFVHVQDGTENAKSNNLVVTSNQTASVGETVTMVQKNAGGRTANKEIELI
jgi:hypothetical protein